MNFSSKGFLERSHDNVNFFIKGNGDWTDHSYVGMITDTISELVNKYFLDYDSWGSWWLIPHVSDDY